MQQGLTPSEMNRRVAPLLTRLIPTDVYIGIASKGEPRGTPGKFYPALFREHCTEQAPFLPSADKNTSPR